MAAQPHASAYLLSGQPAQREHAHVRVVPPLPARASRRSGELVRRSRIGGASSPQAPFQMRMPCDAVRLRAYVDGAVAVELATAWGTTAATSADPVLALHAWYQQAIWQVVASTLDLPSWPDAPSMWRPARDALVGTDLATGPEARVAAARHDLAGCTPAQALHAGLSVARNARHAPPPPQVVDLIAGYAPDPQDALEEALASEPPGPAPAPVVVAPDPLPLPEPMSIAMPVAMPELPAPVELIRPLEVGGMHLLVHDQGPAIARPWDVVTYTRVEVEFTFNELELEEATEDVLAEWAA